MQNSMQKMFENSWVKLELRVLENRAFSLIYRTSHENRECLKCVFLSLKCVSLRSISACAASIILLLMYPSRTEQNIIVLNQAHVVRLQEATKATHPRIYASHLHGNRLQVDWLRRTIQQYTEGSWRALSVQTPRPPRSAEHQGPATTFRIHSGA